ncbi:hypothetical protein EYR40_007289 [Pleurotus pulmonarius]|nr:hypothetical protein EYR40_003077 [Pleurotus pulmonarius]KAF4600178.1 hypothetical protein EYR40_007289 [Pleurotus pulmonarius]
MAKSRKKPRLYVHEPEQRTFVATTSTATRLRHSYVDAPLLSAAITEDRPSQPSTSLEFGVGNPDEAFTDHDPQPVDIINVMPTDGSGLVVKTKAKRYVNSPPDTRWLYGLLLQEDANFKQKSRLRSTDGRDPALGPGWAIFVGGDAYFAHLSNYVDQEEVI